MNPMDQPGPAPQKSNKTLVIVLIVVGVVVACGCLAIVPAILFPVFSQAKHQAIAVQNLQQAKEIAVAMNVYAVNSDDMLPIAETWADSLSPYLSDPDVLNSPVTKDGNFGYAFNEALSSASLLAIPDPSATPLIFNTNQSGNNRFGGIDDFAVRVDLGKPVIAFADSSAKSFGREDDFRNFDWTPKLESPFDGLEEIDEAGSPE